MFRLKQLKQLQSQGGIPFVCSDFSSKVIEEAEFIKLALLASSC